jgi:hypothetical protein
MPVVMDGGCAVVGIAWDVKSATFDGVACNGLA